MTSNYCPSSDSVLVVVPVYNHAGTVRQVTEGVLKHHPHVLVVDDGSTDLMAAESEHTLPSEKLQNARTLPAPHPLAGLPVHFARHAENQGKGAAIRTAVRIAHDLGMSHIVTIDADGQHMPDEVLKFLSAIRDNPRAVLVGARDFNTDNIPFSSRFGRSFSNFWLKVQTGVILSDTQCGFRSYPLIMLENLRFTETRYSFEVEVLVRAAWAGFSLCDIPISVYYPPVNERISHFKALADNVRISLLNTRLTIRSIMPWPHKKFQHDTRGAISVLHPMRSLRLLMEDNATPRNLAFSAALGVSFGTFPLFGLNCILIILTTGALRLNKLVGLASNQLCIPPLVPALCIEIGYFVRNGTFLTDISLQTLGYEALQRIWEWLLGALILFPFFSTSLGLLVFLMAKSINSGLRLSSLKRAGREN